MNYDKIRKLRDRLYFRVEDVADLLDIKYNSARVVCSRYVQKGYFVTFKNNFYILRENWDKFNKDELFKISNLLQVPSYISFMTALSYYDVSTQVQQNFFESACWRRTKSYEFEERVFNYYIIKKDYYFGFENYNGIFIAQKEKALIDSFYLYAYQKYKFDIDSIDFDKLNKKNLKELMRPYPERVKELIKQYAGFN